MLRKLYNFKQLRRVWLYALHCLSGAFSIHINNGEAICIPFTTARRSNHGWRWAVVSVHKRGYINLFQQKKKKKCAEYHFRTYAHVHTSIQKDRSTFMHWKALPMVGRGEFLQLPLHHLYVYSKIWGRTANSLQNAIQRFQNKVLPVYHRGSTMVHSQWYVTQRPSDTYSQHHRLVII